MSDKLSYGIKAGSTDVTFPVILRSSSDNTGLTGATASEITMSYWRQGGVRVAVTAAALASVDGAHSDGGFIAVDGTNQPGLYRVDFPDAAFAIGSDWVVVTLKRASAYIFHEQFGLCTKTPNDNNADIASAQSDITDILADTNELQTDDTPTALSSIASDVSDILTDTAQIGTAVDTDISTDIANVQAAVDGLNDLSAAAVNAEVVDALATDTYAEPGQGAPTATTTLSAKIGYLYKAWRNKSDQDATTYQLYADDASTVDQKATVSDDGSTATKGEVASGP